MCILSQGRRNAVPNEGDLMMLSRRTLVLTTIAANAAFAVPSLATETKTFDPKAFAEAQKAGKPIFVGVHAAKRKIRSWASTTPNGRKASIALEELGLPYTVHPIDIGKDQQLKPLSENQPQQSHSGDRRPRQRH
jgi:hypothetical protein